jgi:AhpD family alkylhydroperoxidase
MKQRLDFFAAAPDLMKTVSSLNMAVDKCGLEKSLLHLIKLRASQINGCSFCVDMHSREARQDGETEQRLYLVAAWKESPLFTERERAALRWVETVTKIADAGVPDELYQATLKHFSEEELVKLTVATSMINTWNRLCVSFHALHPVQETAKAA